MNYKRYTNPIKKLIRIEKHIDDELIKIAERQGVTQTTVISKAFTNYIALCNRNN